MTRNVRIDLNDICDDPIYDDLRKIWGIGADDPLRTLDFYDLILNVSQITSPISRLWLGSSSRAADQHDRETILTNNVGRQSRNLPRSVLHHMSLESRPGR